MEVSAVELTRELEELIAALDRRVPRVEQAGEPAIARDAAALRAKAIARLAELNTDREFWSTEGRNANRSPEEGVVNMPDERQTSTEEGIAPAPESKIGQESAARNRSALTHTPPEAQPDSAMGGTSDADSPADEAWTPKP